MALCLGKSFDRRHEIRIPFLNGHYNLSIFYNKKSTFLLFGVEEDFTNNKNIDKLTKISMYKNLESSNFCETFIKLHKYKKTTLDILNQYKELNPDYSHEISFLFNESISLSKIEINDKIFYDTLNLYGFTMISHSDEFVFVIAERQHISTTLNRKIVRSAGIQISTTDCLNVLQQYDADRNKGQMALNQHNHFEDNVVVL
jgi:hypothetical protein